MDGNSELSQKDQSFEAPKPELQPQKKPLIARIASSLRSAAETLIPRDEKISLDKIDQPMVAEKLKYVNYNLLNERRGENPRSPFTIVDVLNSLGYISPLNTSDYKEKFPDQYSKVRQILNNLTHQGILDAEMFDRDTHNEEMVYKINNLDQLDRIAAEKPPQLTT